MKKKLLIFIVLLLLSTNVYASATEKEEVKLVKCLSASTAWVSHNGTKKVIRLVAYDELDTELNNTIKEYTCKRLKEANKIEIAYETEYDKVDKYNRELVWVYIDDELLQENLISKGYGEVNNAKKVFEHTDSLCASERNAVNNNLGIWSLGTESEDYCKAETEVKTTKKAKKQTKVAKKQTTEAPYKLILFLLVGIVILCIMVGRGKKHEKK